MQPSSQFKDPNFEKKATITGHIYWDTQLYNPPTGHPTPEQRAQQTAPIDATLINGSFSISAGTVAYAGKPHAHPVFTKLADGSVISATKTETEPSVSYCSALYEIDINDFLATNPVQFYVWVSPNVGPFPAGVQAIALGSAPWLATGGSAQCDFQIQG